MITEVFASILNQAMFFIGNIFIIGFVISLLCRLFYMVIGGGLSGRIVCYATGIIGTPIHELSHALMCIVFGHKVVDMNIYNIDVASGTLGYVSHEYNPRNPYHILGNYFIGIAPVLMNTAVIYLLFRLLLPDTYEAVALSLDTLAARGDGVFTGEFYRGVLESLREIGDALIHHTEEPWRFWVFAILILSTALHMNLSGSDIVSALSSLPILVALMLAVNAVVAFFGAEAYNSFTSYAHVGGVYILFALIFSVALSSVCIVIGIVIRLLSSIIMRFNE